VTGRPANHDQRHGLVGRLAGLEAWLRQKLSTDSVVDSGGTFHALRRKCLDDLVLYRGFHRFIPALLKMRGHRLIEVPVSRRSRRVDRSKYRALKRLVVGLADLLVIRWMNEIAEISAPRDPRLEKARHALEPLASRARDDAIR
jgi:hypothetical protein